MAYGQTGSGKTHSMFGSPGKKSQGDDDGASPNVCDHDNHLTHKTAQATRPCDRGG